MVICVVRDTFLAFQLLVDFTLGAVFFINYVDRDLLPACPWADSLVFQNLIHG